MTNETQPRNLLRAGYSVRLSPRERQLIQAAAIAVGEKLSEYVRRALTDTARRDLAGTR